MRGGAITKLVPALLAGVLLAGCGQSETLAGSAALVGDARLSDAELSQTVTTLSEKLGIPKSDQVSQAVLSRWMVAQMVDELAAQKGVTVSKGEVDAMIADQTKQAGGQEAFETGALQAGVLPEGIPEAVRTSLLIDRLSKTTITGDDPSGQTGLITAVQAISEDLDPQVSPRFGTWNAQELTVGALPDDLSTPVVQTPTAQLQQVP